VCERGCDPSDPIELHPGRGNSVLFAKA
jgi:hypothetical protein